MKYNKIEFGIKEDIPLCKWMMILLTLKWLRRKNFSLTKSERNFSLTHQVTIGNKLKAIQMNNNKQNRLKQATSPYLLQHANNPVDWYEWTDEALQKAKAENKPIFLSVGYSACHWCHVMAHESFENDEIAGVMNKYFINIKVDREERPDIDEIYMAAVQMLTGSGGWPMSVWLTPDLKPFYGGTYFPPYDRYGRPGFFKIVNAIANAWEKDRANLAKSAEEISVSINDSFGIKPGGEKINADILQKAFISSKQSFDPQYGGLGGAPKFPHSMELSLLLRYFQKHGNADALKMVEFSLEKMAFGGIYDQLGGGFHRYSTDEQWLVPHFEKMLYDQALLVKSYAEAYQITGKKLYLRIVTETLDYVLERMTSPEHGFYSAEDADSEGKEGKFYVWSKDEINKLLGTDADLFAIAYDVSKEGNWESKNILRIHQDWEAVAKYFTMQAIAMENKIKSCKKVLLKHRNKRIAPGLDDKILADWNGLMISAFAIGYKITNEPKYKNAALKAATFFKNEMLDSGILYHSFRNGTKKVPGFLSDYSFMIAALLDVYSITFELHWIKWATELSEIVEKQFAAKDGGYYFTRAEQKNLIARSKSPFDNALPSGNSVMVQNLVRLSELTGDEKYRQQAWETITSFGSHISQYPQGYSEMLIGLDYLLGPTKQIVIAGVEKQDLDKIVKTLYSRFLPRTVVIYNDGKAETQKLIPHIADKTFWDGKPQFYLCENFTCQLPVESIDELVTLLEKENKQ